MDKKTKKYARYLMIMSGLGGLLYGVDLGVIAAALPYINNSANYTVEQTGAIVGFVLWGSVISAAFAGMLAEWLGRKKMIIISAAVFTISIPIICASGLFHDGNFFLLSLGRILQGVASGFIGVVVPMYLAECLSAKSRGKGTATFQLILTLGLVFAALIGLIVTYLVGAAYVPQPGEIVPQETINKWIFAWQTIFWVCSIPGIALFIGAFKLKESPRWLYKKGRVDEALQSLAANNGMDEAKKILKEIEQAEKEEMEQKKAIKAQSKKETLMQKKYVIPFLLTIAVLMLTQATGMNSVLNYSVIIFGDSGMEGEFANWSDLAIKLVNFFVTIAAVYFVDRKGRKFLLKIGIGGIVIAQIGIAIMFACIDGGVLQKSMTTGIIVTLLFFLFVAAYAFGPGVCVWLALTELMPTRIRANGIAIGMILNQSVSATIASVFPLWITSTSYLVVFGTLSCFGIIYFLIVAIFLPETKGKTLEEISKFFK